MGRPEKIERSWDVRQRLQQLVDRGMPTKAIAEELGVTTTTLYRVADRFGIDVKRGKIIPVKSIRDVVQEMKPLEAVEYLIEAYEILSGECAGREEELRLQYKLSPFNAKLVTILESRPGGTVSMEFLITVMSQQADSCSSVVDWPSRMRVAVSKTRKQLRERGYPLAIVSVGHGLYTLKQLDQCPPET